MSTIAAKARAEAEREERIAELELELATAREDDDADAIERITAELAELAEPAAGAGSTDDELLTRDPADGLEEPTEAMIAELTAACDEHADHVRAIMGSFVEGWVGCEACNGIGLAIPVPAGPQLSLAPKTQVCSVCNGFGELSTGSKRQGYTVISCTNCNGQGWVGQGNMPPTEAARLAAEAVGAPPALAVVPAPPAPPSSTDPRVQALRDEGFIVLDKPGA